MTILADFIEIYQASQLSLNERNEEEILLYPGSREEIISTHFYTSEYSGIFHDRIFHLIIAGKGNSVIWKQSLDIEIGKNMQSKIL
jgi:hypothetical protein